MCAWREEGESGGSGGEVNCGAECTLEGASGY